MSRDYIPSTMGLTTTISSNLGEVNSRGVDFSLDYNKAFDSGLILSGRGNFTYSTNEVLVNGEPIIHMITLVELDTQSIRPGV